MARKRLVTELGRGTDLQGRDYTKAAVRALLDALRRNSLTVVPALGYPREAMEVEIRIGVARPGAVDRDAVAAAVPYGRATVEVVRGGLDVPADEGDGVTVIAAASAVVWLDIDEAEGAVRAIGGSVEGDDERGDGGGAGNATGSETGTVGGFASGEAPIDGAPDIGSVATDAAAGGGRTDGREASDSGPVAPAGLRRVILESGLGADLRGEDATKAACRAVRDALHASSLALFGSLGIDPETMAVEVRVGVQRPGDVDVEAVRAEVPHGRVDVAAETGGLDVVYAELGTRIVVATAAVIARLPLPDGRFALGR